MGCYATLLGPVRQDAARVAWTVDAYALALTWSAAIPVILNAVPVCEVPEDVMIIVIVAAVN